MFIHYLAAALVPGMTFSKNVIVTLGVHICVVYSGPAAGSAFDNHTAHCHSHICPVIGSDFGLNLGVPSCVKP